PHPACLDATTAWKYVGHGYRGHPKPSVGGKSNRSPAYPAHLCGGSPSHSQTDPCSCCSDWRIPRRLPQTDCCLRQTCLHDLDETYRFSPSIKCSLSDIRHSSPDRRC